MTAPIARDTIYRRRRFGAETIETVRALVHHLSAELPRSGSHDGRARIGGLPYNDFTLGDPLRAGVREAMESMVATSELLLEGRRECAAASGVGDERTINSKLDSGLSQPACRSRLQTTASG